MIIRNNFLYLPHYVNILCRNLNMPRFIFDSRIRYALYICQNKHVLATLLRISCFYNFATKLSRNLTNLFSVDSLQMSVWRPIITFHCMFYGCYNFQIIWIDFLNCRLIRVLRLYTNRAASLNDAKMDNKVRYIFGHSSQRISI